MERFTESVVEDAALSWFSELGFAVKHGPEIAPGEPATLTAGKLHAERTAFGETVLVKRLRDAPRKHSGLSGAVRVRPERMKAEG